MANMEKLPLPRRPLGKTGLDVTLLGFGALEIGRDWGLGDAPLRQRPDEAQAAEVLNGVLDIGINLIDTAAAYHRSEERIGRALAGRRHEFVLATKCGEHSAEPGTYYDFSYEAVRDSIQQSLIRLRTDVIDILQIHFGPEPEKVLDEGQTLRAMREAQDAGKVRLLGASPPDHLVERCIDMGVFQVLQVDYSLLHRTVEPLLEKAAERGIGILVRGGLAMGRLTPRVLPLLETDPALRERLEPLLELVHGDGRQLTALALAFLRQNPAVSSILLGSKRLEHVVDDAELLLAGVPAGLVEEARSLV
ncbi:MAG: aldo/keto reductase [Limnochordaceae bacterium]|nr:aldo/keto reductase [Limnochordaceae bacterium]